MTANGRRLRILIAGGGIGGLTAALALLQRGFEVQVFEQASELREVGAGVQISANGSRALHALGIGEAVEREACEASGKEIRLWSSGQTWKLFDLGAESVARYGHPYYTVYRPDLHGALAEAVRRAAPDTIRLGARVASFAQDGEGVTLDLADGSKVRGDALIGADGIHSRIRHGLFGEDRARFSGMLAWRGVIPMDALPPHMRRTVATNWIGPGRHVVHYPLHHGELMNFVGIVERSDWQVESWTERGTTEELAADFAGWHEDVHAMIRAIEVPYKWALMLRPPLERWTEGRVTLLGDACHPTLPMMAQGAVQAIEDGFVLGRALEAGSENIPAALLRYEEARRERTNRMVVASAENAARFHNPALAEAAGAQAYVDREWAEERVRERYDWLFRYRVDEVAV
ncbi:FAD-dependent monooxygenase [Pararoseomonas indoligenes]|uniref:FAD-dependent monooxygenase n=1 Tax=Roseomonas indoligenes TaxID=2820811 RepID=A0A940S6F3_9PROT|nr:FAD-dependent monooxygenase [Pararoseomonas indoligenes]MBP0495461.1 FAD-dependent monooxygenase [Pararoseomonas indoligenes]